MKSPSRPDPQAIRRAREDNPKMRERDLAQQLGISEAEFVAAWCGEGVVRIEPRVNDFLAGMEALGEVMALTRNDSAVHEKIGIYDKVVTGDVNAMTLGEDIDLRIFPKVWAHGFAVEKRDGDELRRSLQFFDKHGEAVHKVHLRPASNLDAYLKLVESLKAADQSQTVTIEPAAANDDPAEEKSADVTELRNRWSALTDVHQFFGMLRSLKISRRQAVRSVGQDYAWLLGGNAVTDMFDRASSQQVPIMCFVGNRGCIQIHKGTVTNIKPMGPWINVLDKTFHLHLRLDHISEVWAVRKPVTEGHVTSIEAYDAKGELIIQFFGVRKEGEEEPADWRQLVEGLPRALQSSAA